MALLTDQLVSTQSFKSKVLHVGVDQRLHPFTIGCCSMCTLVPLMLPVLLILHYWNH